MSISGGQGIWTPSGLIAGRQSSASKELRLIGGTTHTHTPYSILHTPIPTPIPFPLSPLTTLGHCTWAAGGSTYLPASVTGESSDFATNPAGISRGIGSATRTLACQISIPIESYAAHVCKVFPRSRQLAVFRPRRTLQNIPLKTSLNLLLENRSYIFIRF